MDKILHILIRKSMNMQPVPHGELKVCELQAAYFTNPPGAKAYYLYRKPLRHNYLTFF